MPRKIRSNKDLAAERAVLASLCQNGVEAFLDIDFIKAHHFTDHINQSIFNCIDYCFTNGMKVELPSILSSAAELGLNNLLETDKEIDFLRSLFNFPVEKENTKIFAAKLAKVKIVDNFKKTIGIVDKKLGEFSGDEDLEDIVSAIEEPIQEELNNIYTTSDNKPVVIGEEVEEYLKDLFENNNSIAGVSSGFPLFDRCIGGGLRRKCVDVVGARTKVGKSLFADAVAINLALRQNIPVLMIDTEMDSADHMNRILANLGSVDLNDINTANFEDQQIKNRLKQAAQKMTEMPYHYINVSGRDFDYILAVARQWIYREVGFNEDGTTKDCLIIYDYLKMMDSKDISEANKEYQILGFQATKLHNFCVKYDVPCLTFIQLNRDGITKEGTDTASGSDRIMWLCTSFSILKEKTDEEQATDLNSGADKAYLRKIVPVISRHGGGLDPGDYINVDMEGQFARLTEGPTRNQVTGHARTIETKNTPIEPV